MNNLAAKLRTGTQQSHTAAEHTGFMRNFLKGSVTKEAFGRLLGNLYFVYSQLEAELDCHKDHPLVSRVYFPELNRKEHLEADLEFYYGSNWQGQVNPSKAAQAYISRIREVSATEPILLLAHAYTRYMGDLSGGQMLKKIAQAALGLQEHQGVNFYEFEQIGDLTEFKDRYRQALNSLLIDRDLEDKIVAEANTSFSLNIHLLRELEQNFAPAIA